jgi:hypothetical protein
VVPNQCGRRGHRVRWLVQPVDGDGRAHLQPLPAAALGGRCVDDEWALGGSSSNQRARGPSSSERWASVAPPSCGPCGGEGPPSGSDNAGDSGMVAQAAVAWARGRWRWHRRAGGRGRGRVGSVAVEMRAATVSGAGVRDLLKGLGAREHSLLDRIHLIYDSRNWVIVDYIKSIWG